MSEFRKWMRNVSFFFLTPMLFSSGCASTPMLVSEWSNPAYQSPYFKRIAVSCLDGHTSIRRNCEDEFVSQLRAAGIDALPSYRSLPDDATLEESKVKQLAKDAGNGPTGLQRWLQGAVGQAQVLPPVDPQDCGGRRSLAGARL